MARCYGGGMLQFSAMSEAGRERCRIGVLLMGVVVAGLFSRSSVGEAVLPDFVVLYAGDTLWALAVFCGLRLVWPRRSIAVLGGVALALALAVEGSQLIRVPWLDTLRGTRLGALFLGRGFKGSDLVCYAVGCALGVALSALGVYARRENRAI